MPTVPTHRMEQELRALYLRWLSGLDFNDPDFDEQVRLFDKRSRGVISIWGGQAASLGALAGFPVPKTLELSPRAGTIYNAMRQAAISASIAAGLNSREAARAMFRAGMDQSYRKLERLARTETVSAYWKNSWDSVADLPAIVMVWGSEESKKTCDYCLSRDGLVVEDPNIRDHPNGRCTLIPTLRSQVKYKGTLQPDGSVTQDPRWTEKPKQEDLSKMDSNNINDYIDRKGAEIRDYAQEFEMRNGSRDKLLQDTTFMNLRAELDLAWKRASELSKASAAAKAAAKAMHHPKVDKLPRLTAVPSRMAEAYRDGRTNPKGKGFYGYTKMANRDYEVNCTRVAYAMEMRMRGFDISAGPAGLDVGNTKGNNFITANWVQKDGKKRNLKKENTPELLLKNMAKNAPDGARYFVVGPWKNGGAHIWNAEKINGEIVFHEGQVADRYQMTPAQLRDHYLRSLTFDKWKGTDSQVRWMRVDDLEPTDMGITRGWAEIKGKVVKNPK